MIPIINLVLHFGHSVLLWTVPNASAVPVNTQKIDVANGTILKPFHAIHVALFVPALESDSNRKTFFLSFLGCCQNTVYSRNITSNWFFHEYLLALVDRIFELLWLETRRGSNDHHIDATVDGLLVGVHSVEYLAFHIDTIFPEFFLEAAEFSLDFFTIRKGVGDCHQFGVAFDSLGFLQVLGSTQDLIDCSRATPT